jgi:NADH-quinone oxidoreductase subunit J
MIVFWILAVVLIASAVWTVTATKAVYSVVALLTHFLALAFMFVTLQAEFMAMIQMIVYSGAILILFVFVITLLSSGVAPFSLGPNRMPKAAIPAGLVVVLALGFVAYALGRVTLAGAAPKAGMPAGPVGTANVFGSVSDFGAALFTTHLLPFEVTAFILMVAVIGVILLAGDQPPLAGSAKRAETVRREMREAILRGGDE